MAKTLTNLLADVRDFIDDTTSSVDSALLTRYINDGQRYLVTKIKKVWPDYLLRQATASTTASTAAYTMPSDMSSGGVRGIWVYSASNATRYEVKMSSVDRVMGYQSLTGMPRYYCFMQGYFVLAPVPDSVYTLEMWYVMTTVDLVNPGDTTIFKDNECEVITLFAAKRYLQSKGDFPTLRGVEAALLDAELRVLEDIVPAEQLTVEYNPLDL